MKLIGQRKGREDIDLAIVKPPHETWSIESEFIVITDSYNKRTARRIPSDVIRIIEAD